MKELSISCLRHISYTPEMIFMKLGSNVRLIKQMCTWRPKVWDLNYVSAPYLLYPLKY